MNRPKQYTTLVIGEETRQERRNRLKQEKAANKKARQHYRSQLKKERLKQAEIWRGDYLPPEGVNDFNTGRSFLPAAVRPGRATMRPLRILYPFLAEEGLGADGMFIGQDALSLGAFCFDPFDLYEKKIITNPNITLAGSIGTGKSSLMKSIAVRGIALGRKVYVPGDIKGEWSIVAKAMGGNVITLGGASSNRLNPLDEGVRPKTDVRGTHIDDNQWAGMVRSSRLSLVSALIQVMVRREMTPLEHTALAYALDQVTCSHSTPLLGHVSEHLLEPSPTLDLPEGVENITELKNMGKEIGHALARLVNGDLKGAFDGPSTVAFDTSSPMISVDLAAFGPGSQAIPLLMTCTAAWMEAALRNPDAGRRYIIYDEAHRLMGESFLLVRMKDQWKLSRAWGIANVLVLHRFSDLEAVGESGSKDRALAEGLLSDTAIRILYRQPPDQIPTTMKLLGIKESAAQLLPGLATGQGLWTIGSRTFIVNHLLSAVESNLVNTDQAMLEKE